MSETGANKIVANETMLRFQTAMQGVVVTILLAGIPWAYVVQGRLSAVEENSKSTTQAVNDLRADIRLGITNAARLDAHEKRLERLELRLP